VPRVDARRLDDVRPMARHPLQARAVALAQRPPALRGCSSSHPACTSIAPVAVVNVVDADGVHLLPVLVRAVRLREEHLRRAASARHRLRGRAHPLSDPHPEYHDDVRGVPRRQLLPRPRPRHVYGLSRAAWRSTPSSPAARSSPLHRALAGETARPTTRTSCSTPYSTAPPSAGHIGST
jgi:hypothetical protein